MTARPQDEHPAGRARSFIDNCSRHFRLKSGIGVFAIREMQGRDSAYNFTCRGHADLSRNCHVDAKIGVQIGISNWTSWGS